MACRLYERASTGGPSRSLRSGRVRRSRASVAEPLHACDPPVAAERDGRHTPPL